MRLVGLCVAIYLLVINVVGFVLMGADKYRARRGLRRIREATLFRCAAIGGTLGSIAGMYCFRHKTRHRSFVWGMPGILLLQCALAAGIWALRSL